MNEETKLLVDFDSGEITSRDLVNLAVRKIEEGLESDSLNELAWQNNLSKSLARELYIRSTEELSLQLGSREERLILLAKKIAKNIVEKKKDINKGCSEIAEISKEPDSPENLSVFELLAHEQYDHESLGITSKNIQPSIIEEARKLANET